MRITIQAPALKAGDFGTAVDRWASSRTDWSPAKCPATPRWDLHELKIRCNVAIGIFKKYRMWHEENINRPLYMWCPSPEHTLWKLLVQFHKADFPKSGDTCSTCPLLIQHPQLTVNRLLVVKSTLSVSALFPTDCPQWANQTHHRRG